MTGYPHYRKDRYVRDPYTERTLHRLDRSNDPYSARRSDRESDSRRSRGESGDRDRYREERLDRRLPPLLTISPPLEDQRRDADPLERRGPFPSFARESESPPPRASRRRIDSYQNRFGDLPAPSRGTAERLRYDTGGPSTDPFSRLPSSSTRPRHDPYFRPPTPAGLDHNYPPTSRPEIDLLLRPTTPGNRDDVPFRSALTDHNRLPPLPSRSDRSDYPRHPTPPDRDRPYGGGPPPRNPFVPGGDLYDYERTEGHRHPSLERGYTGVQDPEPGRRDHYRGRIGEEWGVAEYQGYLSRRRNEERMSRPEREGSRRHRSRRDREERDGLDEDW